MAYSVKELFLTLQGEGANTGRVAVFCRFSGCNLWSGLEEGRERGHADCARWCDTNFVGIDGPGGGRYQDALALARAAGATWQHSMSAERRPLLVCTGGEPLLQLDGALIDAFHEQGFEVAVETNGTKAAPAGIDWLCVSPKSGATMVQRSGQELKIVIPQEGLDPEQFAGLDFEHFFVQPKDGPDAEENLQRALKYCIEHPQWRLGLQSHKLIGIS